MADNGKCYLHPCHMPETLNTCKLTDASSLAERVFFNGFECCVVSQSDFSDVHHFNAPTVGPLVLDASCERSHKASGSFVFIQPSK